MFTKEAKVPVSFMKTVFATKPETRPAVGEKSTLPDDIQVRLGNGEKVTLRKFPSPRDIRLGIARI